MKVIAEFSLLYPSSKIDTGTFLETLFERQQLQYSGFTLRTSNWRLTENVGAWHHDLARNIVLGVWCDAFPTEFRHVATGRLFTPKPNQLVLFRNQEWMHRTPPSAIIERGGDTVTTGTRNFIRVWGVEPMQPTFFDDAYYIFIKNYPFKWRYFKGPFETLDQARAVEAQVKGGIKSPLCVMRGKEFLEMRRKYDELKAKA